MHKSLEGLAERRVKKWAVLELTNLSWSVGFFFLFLRWEKLQQVCLDTGVGNTEKQAGDR